MPRRRVLSLCIAVLLCGMAIARLSGNEAPKTTTPPSEFAALAKYRTPYMGNASNLVNLNQELSLGSEFVHTFSLNPKQFTAEIRYDANSSLLGSCTLHEDILYDATANFALISNLQTVTFHFSDASFQIHRSTLQQWYGIKLSNLASEQAWDTTVHQRLADEQAVNQFFSETSTTL